MGRRSVAQTLLQSVAKMHVLAMLNLRRSAAFATRRWRRAGRSSHRHRWQQGAERAGGPRWGSAARSSRQATRAGIRTLSGPPKALFSA